jgi:drug/metabolite transporter (DMT)-like permease
MFHSLFSYIQTHFQWNVIQYGILLAFIDCIVFPILKLRHLQVLTGYTPLVFSFLLYGVQSLIFYKSLKFETMAVMNIFWNMASNILVTIIGIYGLKEKISKRKLYGILLGFVALYLLSTS